ncbi:hypothetical protein FHY55_13010 [Oceanicola sp. D3]|uniref:hypothetical protein n=1 Tax=Oceanicola sp. D3 TaxID=2587163 RepID=UPI0011244858|nr:hypothetical protein [Oceanicola sp. D3]QDC10110.1 hypothetical protein FHY55_13010 [Oceanicola sp. D3]
MEFGYNMKKDYPRCTTFLQGDLPTMVYDQKAFEAFKKHGEMSDELAKKTLRIGAPPTIRPAFLKEAHGKYYGAGSPKLKDTIFLSTELLAWYEFCEENRNDVLLRKYMLIKTMHEMVHWGDEQDGVDQAPEEGEEFEKEACGYYLFFYRAWAERTEREFRRRFPRAVK